MRSSLLYMLWLILREQGFKRFGRWVWWNPRCKALNEWGLEMVEEFIAAVQNRKNSGLENNKLFWKKANNGIFLLNLVLISWTGEDSFFFFFQKRMV